MMQAPAWDNPELVAAVEQDGLGSLDGLRIYCCGPMSGVEHYNFPAFSEAAEDLRERGHIVFSPAEMDEAEGVVPPQNGDKPEDYADFLLRDLSLIARERVTALACLPGWEDSPGALTEVAFARALGLEILRYPDLSPVTEPTEIRVTSKTGGQKGRKLAQLGAIDPQALMEVAKVAGFGAQKYERLNYLRGFDWSLSYDAMQRHLHDFWSGIDCDEESGLPHLAHAGWHVLALLAFSIHNLGEDDRWKP